MSIQELYHDAKFEEIVFFLTECGFSSLDELASFDFDELFFVPGVSGEAVEEARGLYLQMAEKMNSAEEERNDDLPQCETIEESSPQEYDQQPGELEQYITDCIVKIHEVATTITLQQFNALKEYILKNIDIEPELFNELCDDLQAVLKDIPEAEQPHQRFSEEEKEILQHTKIEPVFVSTKRGNAMVRFCREKGMRSLWDLVDFDFAETKIKGLGPDSRDICRRTFWSAVDDAINRETGNLKCKKSPVEQFQEAYDDLKENEKTTLFLRAQGETLQGIGNRTEITRERVRQIVLKVVRKLKRTAQVIVNHLTCDNPSFYKNTAKSLFNSAELFECFAYVLENSDIVKFVEFADKYVLPGAVPKDYFERLEIITDELVGDSVYFFDILDDIEKALKKNKLSFLDASDYMGYLFSKGYIAMGDYLMKKRSPYQWVCKEVVSRYFKRGIKLDSDENNADMQRLREIVSKEYGGFVLPESNRAITARVSPSLILCGKGRYCAPESVVFDESVFEQIVDYINEAEETSLYYSEIFNAFSGRLCAETSVDNAHFLHGMLKYLYPNDFEYERDMLIKHGTVRISFAERLTNAILGKGEPITKKEIVQLFPGVSDARIINTVTANEKLILWDYNEFNHIDNIICNEDDIAALRAILNNELNAFQGYCSENKFFEAVKRDRPDFIDKNGIVSERNMFYIAAYLFPNEFRFSRPHIASLRFPVAELINSNIARYFFENKSELMYPDLVAFSQAAGWSHGMFELVLKVIEKDYARVELNRYINKSLFTVERRAIDALRQKLGDLTRAAGYYGLFAIFGYKGFPDIGYEWNEFLLQSIIENYDTGYRLLEPTVKDRRYLRGIIVPQKTKCDSYEDFVIAQMKKDGISSMEKEAFSGYLRRKGLVLTATIPVELYEGDGLRLKGNQFVFE